MRKLAVYCETLNHARAIHRWFQAQNMPSETQIFLINVLPAFAYSEIGEGAGSFKWGHPRLQERHHFAIRELAHELTALGLQPNTHLLVGSRAAELAKFCNTHAIDQLCLVRPVGFWFDRFMTQQLIKKIRAHTNATIVDVAS
jgi:hypothetical protein